MKVDIKKNTDQLNYEDFLGGVTRTVIIAKVEKGRKEAQYDIAIEGDERYWRPPPTVLKQLKLAYGDEGADWVGKAATLYGDPDVKMKGVKVGGIRVSHLSHIDEPLTASLSVTRGQTGIFTVQPLSRADYLRAEWKVADPERKKAIEAEVAGLQQPAEVTAEDAFEPEGGDA
jgi:hypothetical protein